MSDSGKLTESGRAAAEDIAGRAETPLVAVVGMGLAVPKANNPAELWDLLCDSEPVFSEPGERFDLARFWSPPEPGTPDRTYARLGGYIHDFPVPPAPTASEDPEEGSPGPAYAHIWLKHALRQAMEPVTRRAQDRCGCYVGNSVQTGQRLEESLAAHAAAQAADRGQIWKAARRSLPHAGSLTRHLLPDFLVQEAVDSVLPSGTEIISLDTACSSALYAIDLGVRKLLAGQQDITLCGGVEEMTSLAAVLFCQLKGLTPTEDVRSFDAAANGTLFTDAACVVALKTVDRAQADGDRILGVLAGFGAASDGRGKAIYAPNPTGQTRAMARARAISHLRPADVDWIVAHATGTVAGDSAELASIRLEMDGHPVAVTSNKSLLGHTGWAAGAVSVVHALLAMQHDRIPAQQRFQRLPHDAQPGTVAINTEDRQWPARQDRPRTAGISSFGFGGTNAHLIVRDRPAEGDRSARPLVDDPTVLVGWSALLPGDPDRARVQRWLREGFPKGLSFGTVYPEPPFAEVRLSRNTLRDTDRTQLMAVQVVERFRQEHGAMWEPLTERTGVFSGYFEPPRLLGTAVNRIYRDTYTAIADDLTALGRDTAAAALRKFAHQVDQSIPPLTEDVLPGLMPNVVAGRVANRFDLHGPSVAVGAGRDSVLCAVDLAQQYLRSGDLDFALVMGVSGNATEWAAELTGTQTANIAEGAFLLALTRSSIASRFELPVLGVVRAVPQSGASYSVQVNGTGTDTTFLSADGAVAILRALEEPAERVLVTGTEARPSAAVEVVPRAVARRLVMTRRADCGTPTRPAQPAIPPRTAVLTNDPAVAAKLADYARAYSCIVICTTPGCAAPTVHTLIAINEHSLENIDSGLDTIRHLRVIAAVGAAGTGPQRPPADLTRLHETYFLAAKKWHSGLRGNGSIGCLLLDGVAANAIHPHASLFTGTTRALSRELPDNEVFAIATTDHDLAAGLAQLSFESARRRNFPAVEYRDGVRTVHHGMDAPVRNDHGSIQVTDESVVVAAGGARGITAECLLALARQARPTLWILGTTQIGQQPSNSDISLEEFAATRKEFLRQRLAEHVGSFAQHNAEFDRRLRIHEVHRTLRLLRDRLGEDRVHYLVCDVTDQNDVDTAARRIHDQHGRIDLMLFAAGISRPANLDRKTLADFRTVLNTKVAGYHNLRQAFREHVATWCSFGSMAATMGLPGETDYVAGNEYLHTAAACSPHREFAIAWPAWTDTGILATSTLVQAAAARRAENTGLSPREGAAHFLNELATQRDQAPVAYYGGAKEIQYYVDRSPKPQTKPVAVVDADVSPAFFLDTCLENAADHAVWQHIFDPLRDSYLADHLVSGRPTVPATVELEMAAQAATALVPGTRVRAFSDARFTAFLQTTPDSTGSRCRITARLLETDGAHTRVDVQITSDFVHANGTVLVRDRPHARFTVHLVPAYHPPIPPQQYWQTDRSGISTDDPCVRSDAVVRLSGPFDVLRDCLSDRHTGSAALELRIGDESVFGRFLMPVVTLDALARTAVLIQARQRQNSISVPTSIDWIEIHTTHNDGLLATRRDGAVILHASATEATATVDCTAVAPDGQILLRIKGLGTKPAIGHRDEGHAGTSQ
ncbi:MULTISPECIES: SDR family oxidoreductase [Amycolatopsis]|uniref:SDR family oxidoreductase n=1 Tax=Amycolatopsis albidoflavus TaxID=102226 RepID=A0ABW5HRU9_9PSEU